MSIAPVGKSFRSEDRLLPHDLNAEQSALGGMMLSIDVVHSILAEGKIQARDFYAPKHEMVFTAISNLANHGEPTDVITVNAELTKMGKLAMVGGAEYLHELTAICSNSSKCKLLRKDRSRESNSSSTD